MKVHHDLHVVEEYLNDQRQLTLQDFVHQFDKTIKRIRKFKEIDSGTKILEVGTGSGWFPILCKKHEIAYEGLEICPQLVNYAYEFGRRNGVKPDIRLGNIEEEEIGQSKYDIIIALSTFEHVEHWQKGLRKIYEALKPGGLFYFYSTNRFSLRSGEFNMPFYGWLPDRWRYRIRVARSGEEIMKLGIDFNQFNHFQLKRFFAELGFERVLNQFAIIEPSDLVYRKWWKIVALKLAGKAKTLRLLGLCFSGGTLFICIK
jgi:2-polyprenyl-3-methyl-5-hydroxy-6-metoxy-1,4-benzoquinol methylase